MQSELGIKYEEWLKTHGGNQCASEDSIMLLKNRIKWAYLAVAKGQEEVAAELWDKGIENIIMC